MRHAILLISCPDRKGITATVTDFVYRHNGNIIHADQHIDEQSNTFFMRIEWDLAKFSLGHADIQKAFAVIARKFAMTWSLSITDHRPSVAVFVSKHLHCLHDLLLRYQAGQFPCRIALIVSNHLEAELAARQYRVPFYHFPIARSGKTAQERKEIQLLKQSDVELVILARYHQILSPSFVAQFRGRIINIHHSFLPAFVGKEPYLQAYKKGVKIIGATSHYVTPKLDEGPIIEQDTVRVSHRDSLEDLKRKGEDLEKLVLSRAVLWHLQRKILSYGNKTVIFD